MDVCLATESGTPIPLEYQSVLDGQSKTKNLDDDKRATFSLKMLTTSGEYKFRLLFRVCYHIVDSECELVEDILSQAFRIESNKKKNSIGSFSNHSVFDLLERPKLLKIKPDEGACIKETEVWIWGAKFAAKANMRVLFGNVCATITATEGASILCCTAPARYVTNKKLV